MSSPLNTQVSQEAQQAALRQVLKQVRRDLSTERVDSFRQRDTGATESNPELIGKYFHNVLVAQSVYPALHAVEVILRNRVYSVIRDHVGPVSGVKPCTAEQRRIDDYKVEKGDLTKHTCAVCWLDASRTPLDIQDVSPFLKGRERAHGRCVRLGKDFTEGRLIAALDINFWVRFFGGQYTHGGSAPLSLWPELLIKVFPYAPAGRALERKTVEGKLGSIKTLRNAVFHQEPVAIESIRDQYEDVLGVIHDMSPTSAAVVRRLDRFAWALEEARRTESRGWVDLLHDCPLPTRATPPRP